MLRNGLLALALALLLTILWDAGGRDMAAARLFGSTAGFALRDNWFMTHVMHNGARNASWVLVFALLLGTAWPRLFLRRIDLLARIQLVVSIFAALVAVSVIKHSSTTSCPWDLSAFGGLARHVSHWAFGVEDGGGGHCFPAGHASAGFAYLCGWFAFRRQAPQLARIWLITALAAGFILGIAQQMRGAHFMSHTFWTACISWATACAVDALFLAIRRRRARHSGHPATSGATDAAEHADPAAPGSGRD